MKKILLSSITIILLSSIFANTSITMTKPVDDNSTNVSINVTSNNDVYGVQFDLKYDPSELSVDASELTSMINSVNQVYGRVKEDGLLRVVMFDLDGSVLHSASNANTSIISIPFKAANANSINTMIEFDNVIVAGFNGKDLEATADNYNLNADISPIKTALTEAYPNPFNPSTTISYDISTEGMFSISIYDIKGAQIITLISEYSDIGSNSVVWNGRDDNGQFVASGMYIVKMTSNGSIQNTMPITLMK